MFVVDVTENKNHLTFFIDTIEGRVDIDQCAKMNRSLHKHFEENEWVANYIIDVSSPGMGNPLKHPLQYKKRVGKPLIVKTSDGNRIEGILQEYNETDLKIKETIQKSKKNPEEIKEHILALNQIKKSIIPIKISKK